MLKDKRIFVAGACGLLGKAICKAILEKGGDIVLADLDSASLATLKTDLTAQYKLQKITSVEVDITSKASVTQAIDQSVAKHGRIDALVTTAYPKNKNYGRHFFDVQFEDFCENHALHLGGYFLIAQQFARHFSEAKQNGHIINIASIYGAIAPKFEIYEGTDMTMPVEYASIKSALIHLTSYMAKYLKNHDIRVNCVSPGGILNKQPDSFIKKYAAHCASKGMLNPGDIAGTIVFLLSEDSRFINGQNIIVDDGFTL